MVSLKDAFGQTVTFANVFRSLLPFTTPNTFDVNTSIYAAGENIGGLITIPNAVLNAGSSGSPGIGSGSICGVAITDLSGQNAAMDLILFDSSPTATTFTDHAALTINSLDTVRRCGHVKIAATDYSADASGSASWTVPNPAFRFALAIGNTTLYAALICRGTPTYSIATALQVRILIAQD